MFKKKFPFYHQHDANDCGPTCLRMIAAHYGKRYSLEYIYASKPALSVREYLC